MVGFTIEKILSKNPNDLRGNVIELFKGKPGLQVTFYTRKEGVSFGNHFHKGLDPAKDPELFFLISGKCKVYAYNGFTGEQEEVEIDKYTALTFQKGVYHELTALTDVSFIEYRSTVFDPENPDTFRREEYNQYIKEQSR